MGLRDVLNGMMNGPGGQRQPSTGRNTKGVPRVHFSCFLSAQDGQLQRGVWAS
jgi:hypothetical protein